jgi:hypothetical protein
VREAIAAYAADAAGSRDDLDETLESATLESWRDDPTPGGSQPHGAYPPFGKS